MSTDSSTAHQSKVYKSMAKVYESKFTASQMQNWYLEAPRTFRQSLVASIENQDEFTERTKAIAMYGRFAHLNQLLYDPFIRAKIGKDVSKRPNVSCRDVATLTDLAEF